MVGAGGHRSVYIAFKTTGYQAASNGLVDNAVTYTHRAIHVPVNTTTKRSWLMVVDELGQKAAANYQPTVFGGGSFYGLVMPNADWPAGTTKKVYLWFDSVEDVVGLNFYTPANSGTPNNTEHEGVWDFFHLQTLNLRAQALSGTPPFWQLAYLKSLQLSSALGPSGMSYTTPLGTQTGGFGGISTGDSGGLNNNISVLNVVHNLELEELFASGIPWTELYLPATGKMKALALEHPSCQLTQTHLNHITTYFLDLEMLRFGRTGGTFTNPNFSTLLKLRGLKVNGNGAGFSGTLTATSPLLESLDANSNNLTAVVSNSNVLAYVALNGNAPLNSVTILNPLSVTTLLANGTSLGTSTFRAQVESMSNMLSLQLGGGNVGPGTSLAPAGFGAPLNLSSMLSLVSAIVNNCDIQGALTMPVTSTTTSLRASYNFLLTSVSYYSPNLTVIQLDNTQLTAAPVPTSACTTFRISMAVPANNTTITTIDASAMSSGTLMELRVYDMGPLFTSVTLSATAGRVYTTMVISNCPNLTTLNNFANISVTVGVNNGFTIASTNLNLRMFLGTKIRAGIINATSSGMTTATVDQNIQDAWDNRVSGFASNASTKVLQIGGTNGSPTGTYQMPTTGYSGSIHDASESTLTTASAGWSKKELIWVLVNLQVSAANTTKRYNWAITYTS